MPRHNDNDPVVVSYEASSNITFHGTDEIGFTWEEWRELTSKEREQEIDEYLYQLVDLYIEDDEDD